MQHRLVEPLLTCTPLPPALATAIEEMCLDLERYSARTATRQRVDRCVTLADSLIQDLERLLQASAESVPASWQPRLQELVAQLPPRLRAGLDIEASPGALLRRLLQVEEELFGQILGDLARALHRQQS